MRTPRPIHSLPLCALIALGAFACEGGAPEEEGAPADTAPAATETEARPQTGLEAETEAAARIMVENPMPHAMIVRVEYPDGGGRNLGSVPANGQQTFSIAASPGESVTLVARDEAETHAPQATITLTEGENVWRIE